VDLGYSMRLPRKSSSGAAIDVMDTLPMDTDIPAFEVDSALLVSMVY
jgi:hypothetical protein